MAEKIIEKKKDQKKPNELVVVSRFVRMAPDKIRLVGKSLQKKELFAAINTLQFSKNLARKPLLLTLKNAASQIKDRDIQGSMFVKTVVVDEGPKLKRRRIIHRGRATSIVKRQSHIKIFLSDQAGLNSRKARG